MVRLSHMARFYGFTVEELLRIEAEWSKRLKFVSTVEDGKRVYWSGSTTGLAVLDDNIRRVPAPLLPPFPLHSVLCGGHWCKVGYAYFLRTKRTPKAPRCYHRPLQDVELGGLILHACPICGKMPSEEQVGHVYNAKKFGKKKRAKSSYRAVPTAGDDTPNNGENVSDPRGERDPEAMESERQYIARFEWMWKRLGPGEPVITLDGPRFVVSLDAPEIEYRRQRADVKFFTSATPRYRAPHAKVRDLLHQGFTQKEIARKLRVTERTIHNRITELPPEPPKEMTAADLLPLRVARGGGWSKGKSWQRWTKKPFWPGAEVGQQGSREARPSDLVRPRLVCYERNEPAPALHITPFFESRDGRDCVDDQGAIRPVQDTGFRFNYRGKV
jgi:hypothetical protein